MWVHCNRRVVIVKMIGLKMFLNWCVFTDKEVKTRLRRVQTSNWDPKGTRKA